MAEFSVQCIQCGDALLTYWNFRSGEPILEVEPCEVCLETATEEAVEKYKQES